MTVCPEALYGKQFIDKHMMRYHSKLVIILGTLSKIPDLSGKVQEPQGFSRSPVPLNSPGEEGVLAYGWLCQRLIVI